MKRILFLIIAIMLFSTAFVKSQTRIRINDLVGTKALSDLSDVLKVDSIKLALSTKAEDSIFVELAVATEGYVDTLVSTVSRKIYPLNGVNTGIPITHTGTIAETTLLTFSIPAYQIGTNGSFHILLQGRVSANTSNSEALRVKFNGQQLGVISFTSVSGGAAFFRSTNINSLSHQRVINVYGSPSGQFNDGGSFTFSDMSTNTAATIICTVTAINGSVDDVTILESIEVIANP